jgi:cytochrome c5
MTSRARQLRVPSWASAGRLGLLALALVLPFGAACARRSPPLATVADARRGSVELAELQQGRDLLLRKCAGCHQTPMPDDHGAAEWPTMLTEMAERAKLDVRQRGLIETYLVTMSTR